MVKELRAFQGGAKEGRLHTQACKTDGGGASSPGLPWFSQTGLSPQALLASRLLQKLV